MVVRMDSCLRAGSLNVRAKEKFTPAEVGAMRGLRIPTFEHGTRRGRDGLSRVMRKVRKSLCGEGVRPYTGGVNSVPSCLSLN
jgi:hypothetical protein